MIGKAISFITSKCGHLSGYAFIVYAIAGAIVEHKHGLSFNVDKCVNGLLTGAGFIGVHHTLTNPVGGPVAAPVAAPTATSEDIHA